MTEWISNFFISLYITGFTWLCFQLQPPRASERFDAERQEYDEDSWYAIEQHEAEIFRKYQDE